MHKHVCLFENMSYNHVDLTRSALVKNIYDASKTFGELRNVTGIILPHIRLPVNLLNIFRTY